MFVLFVYNYKSTGKGGAILTTKSTFANNLKRYMELNQKSRRDVCEDLGFSYYTFSDWVNGKKYPRMDKVEMLANYFGIQKSDLIEEKLTDEQKAGNDTLANIIVRLRMDADFRQLVESLYPLDAEKIKSVQQLLQAVTAFTK